MDRMILIRFDDICPTMNYEQFNKAMSILDENNIKPLIGVIPDCKDPDLMIDRFHEDFWQWLHLLENKGYKIAMHGYEHQFPIDDNGKLLCHSEFAGLSFQEQYDKIKRGKAILEDHGIFTDVFFAPAHTYDINTLKALAANGFKYMSDCKSSKPYELHGIKCLPCRASGCPKIRGNGLYTAVFHAHEWTRPDKAKDFQSMVNLIRSHRENIVDFNTYSEVPSGNLFFQRIVESLYFHYERNIQTYLRKIKHFILK